jgi:mRNA interferase MazF
MTKTGTTPEQGDILLIPVPFTDLSSQKRRPVIVISNDSYNRSCLDLIVVAMTSNLTISAYGFQITNADLVDGALNRPGSVRADKVYTLARSIAIKKFGKVSSKVVDRIRLLLDSATVP